MLLIINMIGAVVSSMSNRAHQLYFYADGAWIFDKMIRVKVFQFVPLELSLKEWKLYVCFEGKKKKFKL